MKKLILTFAVWFSAIFMLLIPTGLKLIYIAPIALTISVITFCGTLLLASLLKTASENEKVDETFENKER